MKKFILTTETAARFFDISNKKFLDKTFGYRWSGAIQDINMSPLKDNQDVYALTGIGAFQALPFIESDPRVISRNQLTRPRYISLTL